MELRLAPHVANIQSFEQEQVSVLSLCQSWWILFGQACDLPIPVFGQPREKMLNFNLGLGLGKS